MTKAQMLQLRMQVAGWGSLGIALNTSSAEFMVIFGLMSLASFSIDIYILKKEQS